MTTMRVPNVTTDHPLKAALLMLGSSLCFGLMAISIRLASEQLHAFEIAFFRNFFGFIAAAPLLMRHGPGLLRTNRLSKYFLRCALGMVAMLASFWAITQLPLAQAISITYSSPIFVTIAATFLLGELVRARRWAAVVLGFIGVLIIVRPGAASFNVGSLAAVTAAVVSALVAIQMKQLTATESANAIVVTTSLIWVPMSLLPAMFVWVWPQGATWLWIMAAGFLGTGGHMLWTRALKLGEVSALTPISFAQLPIVAVAGWLMFGEQLDRWTVLGATIILGSNAYIAHREAVLARRARSAAASAAIQPAE